MSSITVFNFESNEVRTIVDTRNNSPWFVLKDVLAAMGSTTRPAIAKTSIEEVFGRGYTMITPLQTAGGRQEITIVNEPATTFLISRSNTEVGKKMNRWIHGEVLPSIRKTGSYTTLSKQHRAGSPAEMLEGAEVIARVLNLTGSSLVGAMKRTVKANYPALLPMIPDYAIDAPVVAGQEGAQSSEVCFSLTELLKRSEAQISAVKINKLLIKLGILEEKERPSSKGGIKKFKCITKSGLKYGKNVVSEQNPRETQPQWFESTFDELLALLT